MQINNRNQRQVTFKLPLDQPVFRKNVDYTPQIGRPGSTPINEDSNKLAALKGTFYISQYSTLSLDPSGILEVRTLLEKFNAKRLAEQQQETPQVIKKCKFRSIRDCRFPKNSLT
jgi:hypothetical protein